MLHHGIGVGIASACKEVAVDLILRFKLQSLRAKSLRVDVGAKFNCRQIGCWYSQFSQPALRNNSIPW